MLSFLFYHVSFEFAIYYSMKRKILIILALTFVTIGLCQIIQRKMIGILLVCAGIEIGLSIAVDLGTAERK